MHNLLNPIEADVRTKHQLAKCTGVILGRIRLPFCAAGPPEDFFKIAETAPHLRQGRATEVEEDIRIPTRDFGCPFIFWVAAVRAYHCSFWKATRNFF